MTGSRAIRPIWFDGVGDLAFTGLRLASYASFLRA
jgi:hypothetical protein